jgi:hypothetical protein
MTWNATWFSGITRLPFNGDAWLLFACCRQGDAAKEITMKTKRCWILQPRHIIYPHWIWIQAPLGSFNSTLPFDWVYPAIPPLFFSNLQGPVVQRWVSANPGLNKFISKLFISKLQGSNLLSIQTRTLKKYFQIYRQAVKKFALNFNLT